MLIITVKGGNNMKKLLTAILTVAMLLTVTACGQNASPVGTTPSATPVETPEATPTPEVTPTPVATPTPMATPTPQPTPVVTPTPQPLLDLSETESYQLERVTEEQDFLAKTVYDLMLKDTSMTTLKEMGDTGSLFAVSTRLQRVVGPGAEAVHDNLDVNRMTRDRRHYSRLFSLHMSKGYYMFTTADMLGTEPADGDVTYIVFGVGFYHIESHVDEEWGAVYKDGTITLSFGVQTSGGGATMLWEDIMITRVDRTPAEIENVVLELRHASTTPSYPVNYSYDQLEVERDDEDAIGFVDEFIHMDGVKKTVDRGHGITYYYFADNKISSDCPDFINVLADGSSTVQDKYFPISFSQKAYLLSAKDVYGQNAPENRYYLLLGMGYEVTPGDVKLRSPYLGEKTWDGYHGVSVYFDLTIEKKWSSTSYGNVFLFELDADEPIEKMFSIDVLVQNSYESLWSTW